MSFRAQMRRMTYIDSRLRHLRDFPSAAQLVQGLSAHYGENPSTRTIQRDVEKLREKGAPIEYDPHHHGYYYTEENWQFPATLSLTEGDLMALMVADRALSGYRNSPFYDDLREVFERLTHTLPKHVSIKSEDLVAKVTVITDPVTRINEDVWNVIQVGMRDHRTIDIDYQAPAYDTPARRRVDPLHLVGHRGEWYLLCWSHDHSTIRIYALNRTKSATLRTERFNAPPDFRPEHYFDPSFGVFVNETAINVSVRFYGEAAAKIPERQWHPEQSIEELSDGSIIVRFRTNQQSQVLFWVSQWGPQAEIVEPKELRDRAQKWFEQTSQRYTD